MEMPHLPQTAYFPASFLPATESFIHYLTGISLAAIGACCFSSCLQQTKRKKKALCFAAASEHLSLDRSSFLFCLCLAHKQIEAIQTLWLEKSSSKCRVFLRLPIWIVLRCCNFSQTPIPLLLCSVVEEGTNTYTPASADDVCW